MNLRCLYSILDVSQLYMDMQTTPPSLLISVLWMMGSVVYSMGNIIKQFSDFYFSSYCEKFIEN